MVEVTTSFGPDEDTDGNRVKVGFYKVCRTSPRPMSHWFYSGHFPEDIIFLKSEVIPEGFGKPLEVIVEPIKS